MHSLECAKNLNWPLYAPAGKTPHGDHTAIHVSGENYFLISCRKKLNVRYILLLALVGQVIAGCSNTRYLTGDQILLKKNDVSIQSAINYKKIRRNIEQNMTLDGKLSSLAKQQPNKKTLGLFKLNLTIYNRFYTDKEKGFYHWLITTIGEPPVLFDSTTLPASAQLMHEYMVSKGYLLPSVRYEYKIRRRLATPHFFVTPGPLYTIDTVFFPTDSSTVIRVIDSAKQNTILKKGDAFDADVMGNEQTRLLREFQNKGYYHFLRSYIYFEADTFNASHTANIYVRLQPPADTNAYQRYTIQNIYVRPDYDPQQDLQSAQHDTILYDRQYYIDATGIIKPEALAEAIFIVKGLPYSRKDYDYTLNRLADLGVFKFINIRFEEKPDHLLDCLIYLTPAKKHAMTSEIEASNIEDNVGGAVRFTFKDKNVFQAANQFDASLNAGIQIPVLDKDSLIFSVTGQLNFYLPRFVVPFSTENISRYVNPRTKISLIANFYQQTGIYTLNSYSFTFGYEWKQGAFTRHIFNPFSLSFVKSHIISPDLQARLEVDPFLKQSFEDQFISGLNYTYLFSNQDPARRKNFTLFRISGEIAGNTLYVVNSAITTSKVDSNGNYTLFNISYANFFRLDFDIRRYFQFSQNRSFVMRFAAGEAINYWNSDAVPYVKQFYLGGTSSMRAWRVRSLGPGSYKDSITANFFNSSGDIKLEGNLEYRFNIFGRLKGAAFVDAGNIWLRKKDDSKPGANFELDHFIEEIAIGTGLGFRFDFTFFVIRLDVATQVRDPSAAAGDRWVIDDFTLKGKGWKENLVFNLAIGYPF